MDRVYEYVMYYRWGAPGEPVDRVYECVHAPRLRDGDVPGGRQPRLAHTLRQAAGSGRPRRTQVSSTQRCASK